MGRSPCSSQNQHWKERSRSGTSEAETAAPQILTKFGLLLPIFAKNSKFFQKFFSFLHTFRTRILNLSISKGRSPIRARVRTTPVFGKKADGSTAERRAGEDQTRAAGHGPATPPTPTFARVTPKGLWTREPSEARPEAHSPRARLPKLAFA